MTELGSAVANWIDMDSALISATLEIVVVKIRSDTIRKEVIELARRWLENC